MRTYPIPIQLLLLLALARPALAVDGVLEINQVCAVNTGCFPGDAPKYPVTISSSGSYRLTSNLFGIGANTDGIVVEKSYVTIDFNGFAIQGVGIGSGTGNGVAGGGIDGAFAGFARSGTGPFEVRELLGLRSVAPRKSRSRTWSSI